MHLRAIRLRGFKSFPDSVEIRLESGVAVVVGPNGSGKSNVADALLWAAGSLSPSELRAEKADDVLFAGSPGRPPAAFCEVELLFDNEDGTLADLPFAEVSVARRLHRGGEGQYLLNGTTVRRIDLVELLAEAGLGAARGAIVGQGRVEEILSSRPEDRRALVEEAAGLGRFKRRKQRAEAKLVRVGAQAERARDLESELRKRLRPLALQATAAERVERLGGEIAAIEARLAELDAQAVEEAIAEAEERRAAAALERRRTEGRLEELLRERTRAEDELADAAGRRETATAALYRLRSAAERVALRGENARTLCQDVRLPRPASTRPHAAVERAREDARLARERLAALERTLAEREGVPPAARALAQAGERLVFAQLEIAPGEERAVAAALGRRAAAVLVPDPAAGLKLLEQARAAGLGNLAVVVERPAQELLAEVSVVEPEDLLRSEAPAVTRDGYGYDPECGELWFAGEAAEAVLLELEARRRALEAEIGELDRRAERVAAAPAPLVPREHSARLVAAAERLDAALSAGTGAAERFAPALQARFDAGGLRVGELGEELRRLGASEAELRRAASEAAQRVGAIEVELARLEAEAKEARRRLEATGAAPAGDDDREALALKLERLGARREELGRVNPLAKEEYEREKAGLEELAAQRADLEGSLAELERLRAELAGTVERRFAETFAAVSENFEEVAATLFPGGEGRLRLTEPDHGSEPVEERGIEVELRPGGKRVTRLSLLSGGEKALGAIAFLFAVFLARPSPFYLLDEVEAALDDANIVRFVELLRRYADRAQFIVVTHQKRTMEAADILYGVTMGADGVSQIVSRRQPKTPELVLATA